MCIEREQVLGLSFERGVHRQNAQPIYTDFSSFKVLIVQTSTSVADSYLESLPLAWLFSSIDVESWTQHSADLMSELT